MRKGTMHRPTYFLLALTGLLLPTAVHAETLETALRGLTEHHPRIAAASQDADAAEAAKQEAFSGYLPTVDLSAGAGYEEVDRTDLQPIGSRTDENSMSYSAAVTQNLFHGYHTSAATDGADITAIIAEYGLEAARQQILYEGISAYIELLRFQELTGLALDNQDTLRKQLNLEDERVRRGSGIAVDALQAKSRLQVSKERHTAFMGGLKDAVSRYAQVFGHAPDLDSLHRPPLPMHRIPSEVEDAVALATDQNPQLAAMKQNVSLARTARTTAKSGYYPKLDLVARTSYDENVSGIVGEEERHSIRLQSTWQIFSGFADRSRVRQASHKYHSALETAEYTERKIAEEVRFAWSSVHTNKERMELLDNAVNIAGEVYDARTRLRDAGSETALNVLDAENELYRARIDAASARYDYYLSVYRLLFAMGVLSANSASPNTQTVKDDVI